jgi:hypothetical protein
MCDVLKACLLGRFAVEKERRRIEAIKNGKMDELRRAGVPGKYLAELEGSKASF